MESTNNSFIPKNGLEEIQFIRYDKYENVSGELKLADLTTCWFPIRDIFEVEELGPKKSVLGVIIVTTYRFKSDSDFGKASVIEASIKELQEAYPNHLILIPQEFEYQEKSEAEFFCINLDHYSFKPYPYCKFNRWAYPNFFSNAEEIKDFVSKLSECRFADTIFQIDGIISDLECCKSVNAAKVKEFRQYLFDTWF